MTRKYTPRRASKERWLKGAPEYVLDCFRQRGTDGFDVLFTGSLLGTFVNEPQDFAHVYVMGLDVSPKGARCSFQLNSFDAARFRYHNAHRRIKWSELPAAVRESVKQWAMVDDLDAVSADEEAREATDE